MTPRPEIGPACASGGDAGCEICRDEAFPAEVLEVLPGGRSARLQVGSDEIEAALDLLPDARPGDRVLVQLGLAIARIEET